MYPQPRHLAPWAPRTSWDAWFAIAVFPPSAEVRWLKAHFYRYAGAPGRVPLAAAEGFGVRSQVLLAYATRGGQTAYHREVEATGLVASQRPLAVELRDRFRFSGESPRYRMEVRFPEEKVGVAFEAEAVFPVWWARAGRLLHYVGQHGRMQVTLTEGGNSRTLEGAGTLEKAMGLSFSFDLARVFIKHFHWDLLFFHTPGSPADSATGLALMRRGETTRRLKAAARIPGYGAREMCGLGVTYRGFSLARDPGGRDLAIPRGWDAEMRHRDGTFRYRATPSTPVAPLVPGGGMLGFDFEGEWTPASGPAKALSGTGFAEYGDLAGHLAGLAR